MNFKPELSAKVFLLSWRWWDVRNKVNAGEQLLPCEAVTSGVLTMAGQEIRRRMSTLELCPI